MNLATKYMGLTLSSPLVPSASPLSRDLATVRAMEDCGAGAVVLWSLFEEQIRHDTEEMEFFVEQGTERFAESLTYFPAVSIYNKGVDEYLEHIARVKQAVKIPVIASLNGITAGGWTSYAQKIQQAGADAMELNVYYIPTDPRQDAAEVEALYLQALMAVKNNVRIPVAMKLSPFFSSLPRMARQLDEAGADALVLFNRFYQPDIDVEKLEVGPRLVLSDSDEGRLPLRWIAILHGQLRASLAATTGVHTGRDAMKMLLAGADVAMMCSALLKHGVQHLGQVRGELVELMQAAGYESVEEMKGVLSQQKCPEPAAFERANYIKTLHSFGRTATFE